MEISHNRSVAQLIQHRFSGDAAVVRFHRAVDGESMAPSPDRTLPIKEDSMSQVIKKRSARAILLDGDDLVLIRRTRPGQAPYWVTVGGGIEPDDFDVEAALHREISEELGGTATNTQLVHLITDTVEGGVGVQHIFAARLGSMDLEQRTGAEFDRPERGGYEVVRVPFTAQAVKKISLMPPSLQEFITANIEAIRSVVEQPVSSA